MSARRTKPARTLAGRALFVLLCSLTVAITAHVPHALGQEGGGEPASYRSTVREALSEYHDKNFPEARALFEEAHRLNPNARTLRGLGMTAFELRSYRESVSFLKAALESQVKPLEGNLRLETERLLTRAERFVGKLTIHVTPPDANVTIDGNPVVVSGDAPIVLDVGEHTFEFQAEDYLPESRTLYMKGRESETWTVVLNKVPAPVVAAPVAPSPEDVARQSEQESYATPIVDLDTRERRNKRPLYKNPWLWTGVAVVVVAAVVVPVVLATGGDKLSPVEGGDNARVFRALEER